MSQLAAPQLRDTYFIWKGFVEDLVPVYSTGHNRNKYAIWIMSGIAFRSSLVEAAVMEEMWRRTWTGTGLTQLVGGS